MNSVRIPNNWDPRSYQLPAWRYMENGGKRCALVWHRRAGKDSMALNWTAHSMFRRVGNYWHMLPEQAQARKAIWNGIDREGRRIIDQVFPKEIVARTRQDEMIKELVNGSTWQLCGSDNYNSLVGSNPVGVVFSEYSVANPAAWDYIRPILAENGGWAMFIYTSRGRNHGYDLYRMAKDNPEWFAQILTVDDTKVIGPSVIEEERASGMSEDMINQEYFCSFDAAVVGSYYGSLLRDAEKENRVGNVPYDPALPVHTAWDLGIDDHTAIWFCQQVGKEKRIIDYYEANGEPLAHYVQVLQGKNYVYGKHLLPHDVQVRELGTGKSRMEVLQSLGMRPTVVRNLPVLDGIEAVRRLIPICWFDKDKTARGMDCLRDYQKTWDDVNQTFRMTPKHNWASHGADAFRMLAIGLEEDRAAEAINYKNLKKYA